MFRGKGGLERLHILHEAQLDTAERVTLSPEHIKHIEGTPFISVGEKLELILVSLGIKLTSEVFKNIPDALEYDTNKEYPDMDFINKLDNFFAALPFPYYIDHINKIKKDGSGRKEIYWLQVCVNEKVKYFMQHYADTLTEMEEGVLYGYPLSAIRAFSGLIDAASFKTKHPIDYYFAGRHSKQFLPLERDIFMNWWEQIGTISPTLLRDAEKEFYTKYPDLAT